MPAPGSIRIQDYAGEITLFQPNLDATATPATNLAALTSIITPAFNDAMILGLPSTTVVSYKGQTALAGAIPNTAQRELKWLLTYQDTQEFLDPPTNSVPNPYYLRYFTQELGTANPGVLSANSDTLPLGDAAAAAFVAAYNANALSPVGGSVTLVEIRLVGRNL